MIFNFYYGNSENTNVLLNQIVNKLNLLEINIQELTAKVDLLDATLQSEQESIALALAGLNQLVTELNALVADGGTEAERQALADKLDVITADLAATIPDLPEPV